MIRLGEPEMGLFVDLTAKALDLPISPASRASVLANVRILADHAARVMALELPAETAIATDFRP